MNAILARYELKNIYHEKLLPVLLLSTLFFTCCSFYNGYAWVSKQQQVIAAAQQDQEQAIQHAEDLLAERQQQTTPINWWDDVHDLRGYAFYLMVDYTLKIPNAMAPVAVGQSDIFPYFFRMTVGKQQGFIHQHETLHPLLLKLGRFDLAFFTLYVLPLLLIAACYSAMSYEKHSGQLRLLMLQGVSPLRLLLNQLLIRSAIIVIPFIVTTWLLLLWFSPEVSLLQLFQLSAIVLFYALFWIALSALIISVGKTAAHNATTLIIIWLLLVIIVPALTNTWISWLNPAPSRIEYLDTLRTVSDNVEKSAAKTLAGYFQDHPELVSDQASAKQTSEKTVDYSVKKLAIIDAVEKSMQPVEQQFSEHLANQQRSSDNLKYLSPASIVQSALYQLAGNGLHSHEHYMQQTLQHHKALRHFFQTRIVQAADNGDFSPCEGCNARVTFTEFSTMPRFSYRQPVYSMDWLPVTLLFFIVVIISSVALVRLNNLNKPQQIGVVA